jgi:hypothetical protein
VPTSMAALSYELHGSHPTEKAQAEDGAERFAELLTEDEGGSWRLCRRRTGGRRERARSS